MSNETRNSVPKYLSTPERIASELDSIRDRLMTRGIVSGERLYGCDEWSEPVVRLQKVIEALQSPAHDGEVVAWLHTVRDAKSREGDTDLALSFDDHSFPLDSIGWVSIKAQPLYTAPPRVADVEIERIAKGLAESNGWDDWDTAKNVTDTPAGNEPEEEREWYRDMVKFVVSALEQSK